MAADTSSAPAAGNAVVGPAAATLAARSAALIPRRSVAAAATVSGVAMTYDIAASADSAQFGLGMLRRKS
ncbi:hypothetical protein A4G27_24625 [Mycobacterium kansasii]|nr:hypothetical protein A4G27_24625 [Mycobacterium kansasii]